MKRALSTGYFILKCLIISDGKQWAHVNCAWWIPGVTIGNPKEMASIVGIDTLPVSY